MALATEESKARRRAGMERAKQDMTAVGKIQRAFINGRPPASELRTPLAAVTAARVLHRELDARLRAEGQTLSAKKLRVSVAYVTPDLSALGFTLPFAPGEEAGMMELLTGNVPLGLIFGIVDPEAKSEESRIVMGARPFLVTKQTDTWLAELLLPVRVEIELELPHD